MVTIHSLCLTLAQGDARQKAGEKLLDALPWLGAIFAAVLVGGVIILIVRNRAKRLDAEAQEPAGFSLADLRTLRDKGELTESEYEAAKAKILAKAKSSLERRSNELRPKNGKSDPPAATGQDGAEPTDPTE